MKPTDTPRTDSLADKWAGDPSATGYREELEAHARELERELSAITGEEGELWELRQANRHLRDSLASLSILHGKDAERWQRELSAERALADRLAGELESWASIAGDYTPMSADKALAAWRQARNPQSPLAGG